MINLHEIFSSCSLAEEILIQNIWTTYGTWLNILCFATEKKLLLQVKAYLVVSYEII